MPDPREWMIGPHTLRFEPPDLLFIEYQGTLNMEQAVLVIKACEALGTQRPIYVLGDLSHADSLDSEVQRYLSVSFRPLWIRGNIYFGARLLLKGMIKGLILAAQMHAIQDAEELERVMKGLYFVSTREDAERIVRELRARHAD